MNNDLIKAIYLFTLIYLPFSSANTDKNHDKWLHNTIGFNSGVISSVQIKEATFKALLKYNWQIESVTKSEITATYKKGIVRVTFNDKLVSLQMRIPGKRYPKVQPWMNNLSEFILKEVKFYEYQKLIRSTNN
jgi:hypothetical protein